MKKTLAINLNGTIFNIEEDGYSALKTYLDSIRDYFSEHEGSQEILNDIEARAAEKFSEKISATNQAVNLPDVEELIKSMGTIEDIAGEETGGEKTHPQGKKTENGSWMQKKLYRDGDNAVIMGVASGIANYFDIDPVLVRLAFVASLFFGGAGMIIYFILCFVVPEAKTTTQKMKMNGQPINLSSLKEAVEEKIGTAKEKISSAKPIRKMVLIITSIVKKMAHLFSALVGIFIVAGTVFCFIGIFFFFGNLIFNANSPYIDFPIKEFLFGINYFLAITAGFLTAFIPLAFGFLIGISLIKKRVVINLISGIALLMVWIISFTAIGVYAIKIAPQYNEKERSIETSEKTSKSYDFRDFNSISASGDYQINVVRGDGYKVDAIGVDRDLARVEISRDGNELKIDKGERGSICIFCFKDYRQTTINITMPDLASYSASGITTSSIKGFKEEKMEFDLSNSTDTAAEINAINTTIEMSGVAKLNLSGTADNMTAALNNSAKLKAFDFSVKNLEIEIYGASMARALATDSLSVIGKNSGEVFYKGDPRVTKDIDKMNTLKKID